MPQQRTCSSTQDPYRNYSLRNARLVQGLTRDQLAERVELHGTTIYAYEHLHAMPSQLTARKIGAELKVTREELFPDKLYSLAKEIRMERGCIPSPEPLSLDDFAEEELAIPNLTVSNVAHLELQDKLEYVLRTMKYREREIIKLRFGLRYDYSHSTEEVARIFKITKGRVYQIEKRALERLRHPYRTRLLQNFL